MSNPESTNLFHWFENFTKTPKFWADIHDPYKCPFAHYKIEPHHEKVHIDDLQTTYPFVAWLFQHHNCSDFALILQDERKPGDINPEVYSLRSYACITHEMQLSGYVTGVLFRDDLLMMEFKLRFGDIICA